ncbi:MAG: hypothetical protein U0234_22545 [Sandaracinus sp.]
MMVTTTAGKQGALPKVVVVLDPAEIDALLAGGTQRFVATLDEGPIDVELLATSTTPTTPKPTVRLRVADDAIRASRAGMVTPLFPAAIPFTLSLSCSAPAPAGPVRIAPGLTYERIDLRGPKALPTSPPPDRLPLRDRILIGLGVAAVFGIVGAFREHDAPLYWLVGLGAGLWAVFGRDLRKR